MKMIGRNEPCPCGSGKKYKHCCLANENQESSKDALWQKLGELYDQFSRSLLEYAFEIHGPDFFEKAWVDFVQGADQKYDEKSPENQLFYPWMLFNWVPEIEYEDEDDDNVGDWDLLALAESYMEENYDQLSTMERRFLETTIDQPFSFYEIVDITPGYGFRLKDLFLGTEIDVIEKSGSQHAQKGHVLFCRVIQYDQVGMVIGSSSIGFSPGDKLDIFRLRKLLQEEFESITTDVLFVMADMIRLFYFTLYNRKSSPPKLVNTDGDPIAIHEIFYEIDSPQTVFDKLKTLAVDVNEDELFSNAEFEPNGNLSRIEFHWLKRGNLKIKSWENTVLGDIFIEKNQLTIRVNSEQRANTIKKKIATLLGNHAVYKNTVIQPLDSLVQDHHEEHDSHKHSFSEPYPPELQELVDAQLREYWKQWLTQPIPALGNISPKQAMTDPEGREMIQALLEDFELKDRNSPPNQQQQKHIDWIRQQLGLVEA